MPFTAKLYDSLESETNSPRNRTHLTARMSHVANELHHVVVHNLSPQGVLIESYHPLQIGADIAIDISELGKTTARVIWQDGLFYDCLFDVPIPAQTVRSKLTSAKVIWPNFPSHRKGATGILAAPIDPAEDRPIRSAAMAPEGRLSLRARLALIVGAAVLAWAIPIGIALLLIY